MKKLWGNFQELKGDSKSKPFFFFGFYFFFFLAVISLISFGGDRQHLVQEYEKGNSSFFRNQGILGKNFMFDFKVVLDDALYDYYGKRYEESSLFKYNNEDYYWNGKDYFVNRSPWIKCEDPYLFSEFFDLDSLNTIMLQAMYYSKT